MFIRRLLQTMLVLALCVTVAACGFQLRTWDMDSTIEAISISGVDAGGELTRELERAFSQAGVEVSGASIANAAVAGSAGEIAPELALRLLNVARDRRSISVTGQARAAEYELLLNVQYELNESQVADTASPEATPEVTPQARPQTVQRIPPRWVRVQRVYRVDRNNLMGSSEEESLLRREMHNDVVQQILRAVNQVMATDVPSAG